MSTEIAGWDGEKAKIKVTCDRLQSKVDQAIKVLQMATQIVNPKTIRLLKQTKSLKANRLHEKRNEQPRTQSCTAGKSTGCL